MSFRSRKKRTPASSASFTAKGTNSYWDKTITGGVLTNKFDIGYGSGGLRHQGNVAVTKLTFLDVVGATHTVSDVRIGVITNHPYPDWDENINKSPPVMPRRGPADTTPQLLRERGPSAISTG